MANLILPINDSSPLSGLVTTTTTITVAGPYYLSCYSTIPLGSGLQIQVAQNGTPIYTIGGASTNPSATQQSLGGNAYFSAALNDVITCALTSSNAVDALPNAVKSTITLTQTI